MGTVASSRSRLNISLSQSLKNSRSTFRNCTEFVDPRFLERNVWSGCDNIFFFISLDLRRGKFVVTAADQVSSQLSAVDFSAAASRFEIEQKAMTSAVSYYYLEISTDFLLPSETSKNASLHVDSIYTATDVYYREKSSNDISKQKKNSFGMYVLLSPFQIQTYFP